MPLRLLLLAHAATSATRAAAFPRDEAVEPAWLKRTAALAPSLPRADQVLCAPERRSRETAEALGLNASVTDTLRELDPGDWAGQTFDELLARQPDTLARWTADPAFAPPGGESIEMLLDRLAPWLSARQQAGGRIVAITHPAVIRATLIIALGAPATSFWRVDIAPLTQVSLRGDDQRWMLRAIVPESASEN